MKTFIIFCLLAVAFARPNKRDRQTWEQVLSMSEADLEDALQQVPKSEIRRTAGVLSDDLDKAEEGLGHLLKVKEPIKANGDLDPAFMAAAAYFQEAEDQLEEDLQMLPPIPEDPKELHFLGKCIEGAEKTDFDQFTDLRTLANEVISQVVKCAAAGVKVMAGAADLEKVKDEDLTAKELAGRLEKLRGATIEMGHLAKFVMGFIARLENGDFGKVSNNVLVKGEKRSNDFEARLLRQLLTRAMKGDHPAGSPPPKTDDDEDKKRPGKLRRPKPSGLPFTRPPFDFDKEDFDKEDFDKEEAEKLFAKFKKEGKKSRD